MPETMEELKEKAWAEYDGIKFWENGYGYAMFNYAWDACQKAMSEAIQRCKYQDDTGKVHSYGHAEIDPTTGVITYTPYIPMTEEEEKRACMEKE